MKKLVYLIICILTLNLATAVTIDPTSTIINTSATNASITFDTQVNATEIIVNTTTITILNAAYNDAGTTCNTNITYETPNTNLLSSNFNYCATGSVVVSLHPSLTNTWAEITPNFTKITYTERNLTTGNITWYLTDLNLTYPSQYTLKLNNTATDPSNVTLNISKYQPTRWVWKCNETVVTNTSTWRLQLPASTTININCTIDLLNITQTYTNWTLTNDEANYSFTYNYY